MRIYSCRQYFLCTKEINANKNYDKKYKMNEILRGVQRIYVAVSAVTARDTINIAQDGQQRNGYTFT